MDKPDNESLLLSKTNNNLENIKKAYSNGGVSMAEILDKMELGVDLESMLMAANNFIPQDLLDNSPNLEASLKSSDKVKKQKIPIVYIPGKVFFIESKTSCLNKCEQAICLNALKSKQNGYNVNLLTKLQQMDLVRAMELQSQVLEENVQFLEYVKHDWNVKQQRGTNLKESLKSYAYEMWNRKLKRSLSYPQFYKSESMIGFSSHENESQVSVNHIANLHEIGVVPKFVEPSLDIKHVLKISTLPISDDFVPGSKLSVSEDPTVEKLLETTPVDVVISSSGLKQLMDDTGSNIEWYIPVVVKKRNTQSDNVEKTVVHIDKPMTKRFPTPADFNYYCKKLLVKTNFCCYSGINFNVTEVPIPSNTSTCIETEVPTKQINNTLNPNKSIDYIEELQNFSELVGRNKKYGQDKCDIPSKKREIFHNVSYRLWSMKGDEKNELLKTRSSTKDIRVLIRSKLDACERLNDGSVRPLVIVPKLEYQLEHGANVPTKKEIIDQWTALFFRPFSHLYRIRMQHDIAEIVDVQSVNLQKVNTEACTFYDYKPHLRLDNLYEIFSQLTELKPGNYLLGFCRGKGPFVEVYSACDSTVGPDTFNFHQTYSTDKCVYTIPSFVPWTPIDTSYILPVHNTFKRMPGMFKPLIVDRKKEKKKSKKKKKNKNKCKIPMPTK